MSVMSHQRQSQRPLLVAGQVRQLEEAEQLAVEQEDFESAANLSSELDALRFHLRPSLSTKRNCGCQAYCLLLASHSLNASIADLLQCHTHPKSCSKPFERFSP